MPSRMAAAASSIARSSTGTGARCSARPLGNQRRFHEPTRSSAKQRTLQRKAYIVYHTDTAPSASRRMFPAASSRVRRPAEPSTTTTTRRPLREAVSAMEEPEAAV